MMNVLGLSLVLTSLAAAGVFSPSPTPDTHHHHHKQAAANTIVKEGHRVVVVEYDQDGHQNTKISISPPEHHHDKTNNNNNNNVLDVNAKDKIKEAAAASIVPDMQGSQDATFLHAPKDLICDAYGRCKHKIADSMGKAKDKISEMAHEAIDMQKDMIAAKKETAREVGDTVADAVGKAKQTVYNTAHDVHKQTKESVDKAKDKGQTIKEHVVRNVSEARDAVVKRVGSNIVGSMETLTGVANLLGFATAYGMCVWVTFISSYVLSRAMPRQPFGVVQSKIYPVYFRAMTYSIGIALLGHVLGHRNRLFFSNPELLQAYNLLASLFTLFLNSVYLEPRATKLMFERMKIEKEEGRGREDMSGERSRTEEHAADPITTTTTTTTAQGAEHDAVRSRIIKLNDKLKRLNSYSSILNVLNLMSLTWHLVYLAQRLHLSC